MREQVRAAAAQGPAMGTSRDPIHMWLTQAISSQSASLSGPTNSRGAHQSPRQAQVNRQWQQNLGRQEQQQQGQQRLQQQRQGSVRGVVSQA